MKTLRQPVDLADLTVAGRAESGGVDRPEVVGRRAAAVLAFWALIGLYAVDLALPPNPLDLPMETELGPIVQQVLPEGWGFFTRDPRELDMLMFIDHGEEWRNAALAPVAQPSHLLGMNRRPRAQGVELGMIVAVLDDDDWGECGPRETAEECISTAPGAGAQDNLSPQPTLCGRVALVKAEPVPWAWASSSNSVARPIVATRIDVSC